MKFKHQNELKTKVPHTVWQTQKKVIVLLFLTGKKNKNLNLLIELDKDKDFVQDKDSKPNLDECPSLQCQLLAEVVTPMVPFKNYNLF